MAMARGNTAVDLRAMRHGYFEHLIANGIHTDEDLLQFIETFLDFKLVTHKVCPHHDPPATFVTDQFFDRISTCLGFANRLGGKTLSVAILNICDMLFKAGAEIVSAGAIKDQAAKGREYLEKGLMKLRDVMVPFSSPLWVVGSSSKMGVVLSNDSSAKITTANWTGFNSGHPSRLRLDEIELMFYPYIQEAMSMTQSVGNVKAQDTLTSTRKVATGTMQKIMDKAPDLGMTTRSWCIYEVLEPCGRKCHGDPVHGDCPAYSRKDVQGQEQLLCGGKAHDLSPGGWFSISDFVKKVQNLDYETFEAQWLCLRPNQLQVVYGAVYRDESPFVTTEVEEAEILKRYRDSKNSWARIYGQDFGANWNLLEIIQDPLDEVFYIAWEYHWGSERERTVSAHAEYLKKHDPLGFTEEDFFGYGDPAGKQMMSDLEEWGIFFVPANNALWEGVEHVKVLFEKRTAKGLPGIRVFRQCKELRRELRQTYIHPQLKSGDIERDKFFKKDNHACDSLRYALYSWSTIGTASYTTARLRGV